MHLTSAARSHRALELQSQSVDTPHSKSVLLINLGTPSAADVASVRNYLREFLSDPYVIRLPARLRWMNPMLGRLIARFRAKESAKLYRSIWTAEGSPLLSISRGQAAALRELLPKGWQVFLAMRYGQPGIRQILEEIHDRGITELVVIPMYPHFAGPTTGTALELFYKTIQEIGLNISITVRTTWHDDASYLAAQTAVIQEQIATHGSTPENTFLMFSAHGMPVSYIRQGDPYLEHITRTAELVRSKLKWPRDRQNLSFQSKLGPVAWLEPAIEDTLRRLAEAGEKQVLVCPISFTADCLETVQEIGMLYRDLFEKNLGGKLYLCPALNDHPTFISALRSLALRGPQRADRTPSGEPRISSPCPTAACDSTSLLMVGMSVPNHIRSDKGPQLCHDDMEALKNVKIPAEQVASLLHELCSDGLVHEACVLNTCNRFEVYTWVRNGACRLDRETLVVEIMRRVFGERDHSQMAINTLQDLDAIHHLLRTAVGLNSVLPGETDIAEQLQVTLRVARAAGTAEERTETLLTRVIEIAAQLRTQTEWGQYAPSYCSAMLGRLAQAFNWDWRDRRIAVVGRSTTCFSMLKELVNEHQVHSDHITFIHKGSRRDGQIKKMRKLLPKGHKIRVESYDDPATLSAVEGCDLIVYGIDQRQAVLDGRQLKSRLADRPRQRIIVDFNSFGSTAHLEELPGVALWDIDRIEKEVSHYARELCGQEAFQRVVEVVEERVEHYTQDLLAQFQSPRGPKAQPVAARRTAESVTV